MPNHQLVNSQAGQIYNAYIYENTCWRAHFHKAYEVVCPLSGSTDVTIDGKCAILQPGEFTLVLSNQIHTYQSIGCCHYWVGLFSSDFVPEFHLLV